jgi:hypothetical protein
VIERRIGVSFGRINDRSLPAVEAAFYYIAIGAVVAGGIMVGRRARSTLQAMLFGLTTNFVVAVALCCATIVFVVLSPGSLNPHDMGFRLGALLLFGSMVGMVAAIGGRRQAAKRAARLF